MNAHAGSFSQLHGLAPLPEYPLTLESRLTSKQGKLHEHQRQAGEAHALSLAVKPGERRFAEFEYQLVFAELQFHDVLLGEGGLPEYLQRLCHPEMRRDIKKTHIKTIACGLEPGGDRGNG